MTSRTVEQASSSQPTTFNSTEMPRYRSGASRSSSPPSKASHPISTASLFTARAFPPPSLAGVPAEYIARQLRALAPQYWNNTESADCTIVIPVPHAPGRMGSPDLPIFSMSSDPTLGRRATEPALNAVPRISLKLHVDFLCAHSTFLRGLFSGSSSLDLIASSCLSESPAASRPNARGKFSVPENRRPRLMPCSPDHPILLLPVPDPTSIHLIVHWMYFGNTVPIAEALKTGSVEWEGLARNAEYLGLPSDIKVFLGRWFQNWLRMRASRIDEEGEEDGSDSEDGDDVDAVYYSGDDSSVKVELRTMEDTDSKRGRPRPLSIGSAHSV
ncbi:unnamed protein product [Mycena citricolor]|uniref:BTB domain-containing protein n=1 Tax=Mycena citricolor TaxID=2018698 RepID=A0AAD2HM75_9AGAR|nr:unnamed protein product [Mycena citricolor]CAK5278467.1 unnamed protein product [Mycena citricolor]